MLCWPINYMLLVPLLVLFLDCDVIFLLVDFLFLVRIIIIVFATFNFLMGNGFALLLLLLLFFGEVLGEELFGVVFAELVRTGLSNNCIVVHFSWFIVITSVLGDVVVIVIVECVLDSLLIKWLVVSFLVTLILVYDLVQRTVYVIF